MNVIRPARLAPSVLAALVLCAAVAHAQDRRGRASLSELSAQLDALARDVKNAENNLRIVETQYTERPEPSAEEARLRRFSDGEIQYLLGDYQGASVLFYDLVSDKQFNGHPKYADALFFLSDSLYQQKNYVGAKVYLRQLLSLKGPHYKEALARFLEIAGRLNEFDGIEDYVHQARGLSGGTLPPEISYVYGKWLFKREDLPLDQRMNRAQAIFGPLANGGGAFRLLAAYFVGVTHVKLKQYDQAIEVFERIGRTQAQNERERKVQELANLSLGRLFYETGQYDRALDRYQEIPRESEYFPETLYEIAWTQVKKGEYQRAFNAAEILLLVAGEDSPLAPEARILQGHLLLKLKRFDEAKETYDSVINKYDPYEQEMKALIEHEDPVKYFDELLARNDRNLDVTELLPPVARQWATTQKEVANALRIESDLQASRTGVREAQQMANRILKAIDERGLEMFPELQDGYIRADGADNLLTQIEQSLVRIESYLVADQLTDAERAQLEKARSDVADIKAKFDKLPTTEKELEERKRRIREKVEEIDKQAFKLGYEIQSMHAVVAAVEKWLEDTRAQRKSPPEEEKAFVEKLEHEIEALGALEKELTELRQHLAEEKASADAVLSGEDQIRKQLQDALESQHNLIASAETRLSDDAKVVLEKAHAVRDQASSVRARVATAKGKLRAQLERRGKQIRDKVLAEQELLQGYGQEVASVSGSARNLVGMIAFDSFRRVHRQFYELVLKANVGVVDVAFTRKQDKTSQIQKLSSQKDRELRALDEEFKEVLKDVD